MAVELEIAQVQPFQVVHPGILAQGCGELVVPDVDGVDLPATAVQQHLAETAGRRTGVQRPAADLQVERVQCADELVRGPRPTGRPRRPRSGHPGRR